MAVFRVIRDDQTSVDRIEWLLLQGSKWHEKMYNIAKKYTSS